MNARQTGHAVEYLRRSVERDKSADKDRGAGQRAANRMHAAEDGVEIMRTFDGDWGTSGGRRKREKRAAMAELIDAIRAGQVSRVYCHTTDRLARDVEYGMTFWNACKDAGTIIRAGSQTFDPREPGYLTLWTVLLAQAEEDLDRISRKNLDTSSWRSEHASTCELPGRPHEGRCHLVGCTDTSHCRYSHRFGHPNYGERPGEDVVAVIAAYKEAHSIAGTARLLNKRKVPTRMGGQWATVTVRDILVRAGAIDHRTRPGAKRKAPFIFYGLIRCHCGHTLTGSRYMNGPKPKFKADDRVPYTIYKCHVARTGPDHGPGSIPESRLLEWARVQVSTRLRVPTHVRMEAANREQERAVLAERRARIIELYEMGDLSREAYAERKRAIVEAERRLADASEAASILGIPKVDWTWSAERLNEVLRALWREIIMDKDMRPVDAVPLVPEWWAA